MCVLQVGKDKRAHLSLLDSFEFSCRSPMGSAIRQAEHFCLWEAGPAPLGGRSALHTSRTGTGGASSSVCRVSCPREAQASTSSAPKQADATPACPILRMSAWKCCQIRSTSVPLSLLGESFPLQRCSKIRCPACKLQAGLLALCLRSGRTP